MKTYVIYIEAGIIGQLANIIRSTANKFDINHFNNIVIAQVLKDSSNICFRVPGKDKNEQGNFLWVVVHNRRVTIGTITLVLIRAYPLQHFLVSAPCQIGHKMSGNMSMVEEEISKRILDDLCYGTVEDNLEKLVFDLTPQISVVECSYEKLFK